MLVLVSRASAEEPMSQQAAEALARKRWFTFELKPVKTRFHGDWVAFVHSYEKEEPKSGAGRSLGGKAPPTTADEVRAYRVLEREFDEVAQARRQEIRELAIKLLGALQRGELEPLVDDCAMYNDSSKNRRELTRAYLTEHKAELVEAAKLADLSAADFATRLVFSSPSPETGMTGQVAIQFGPKVERPQNGGRSPEQHQLELWWSGEVMPEANGPVHSAGQTILTKRRAAGVAIRARRS
jgi:hypothetical protein